MKCNECQDMLGGYIEEILDEATRAELESHLRECPECQAMAEEFSQLREQLVASGSAFRRRSLEEQVMNQIVQRGTADSRRLAMFKRYARTTARFAVAAAVVVAVGMFFFTGLTERSANAAEMFRAVAAANKAFAGWVHVTFDSIPESMNRPKEGLILTAGAFRFNLSKGIVVKDFEVKGNRSIDWEDRVTGIRKAWSSATGEIIISTLDDSERMDLSKMDQQEPIAPADKKLTPWQIGQRLLVMPTMAGVSSLVDGGWCQVSLKREGEVDRYTLTFNKERLTEPKDAQRSSLVVLVDHKSELVKQWIGTLPDGSMTLSFRYNDPVLNDIYDLGVPADAKVTDYRVGSALTPADAAALLDRMDALAACDGKFGDFGAVLTETSNSPKGDGKSLHIFARRGEVVFNGLFRNLEKRPALNDLAGWPLPDVAATFGAARDLVPDYGKLWDGQQEWWRHPSRPGQSWYTSSKEEVKSEGITYTLASQIWPNRAMLDYKHARRIKIQAELMQSVDRPGLVGLHVDETGVAAMLIPTSRFEYVYWLDPNRDYVPVEKVRRVYGLTGALSNERTTKYMTFAQTPSGQWYPTTWQETDTDLHDGKARHSYVQDCSLQVVTSLPLEDVWFAAPAEHYNTVSTWNSCVFGTC